MKKHKPDGSAVKLAPGQQRRRRPGVGQGDTARVGRGWGGLAPTATQPSDLTCNLHGREPHKTILKTPRTFQSRFRILQNLRYTCVLGSSKTKALFGFHPKTTTITIWLAYSYIYTQKNHLRFFKQWLSQDSNSWIWNVHQECLFLWKQKVLHIFTNAQGKKLRSSMQTPKVLFTVNPPLPRSHVFTWHGVGAALPVCVTALTQALMWLCLI